jgi:hypothetical protein
LFGKQIFKSLGGLTAFDERVLSINKRAQLFRVTCNKNKAVPILRHQEDFCQLRQGNLAKVCNRDYRLSSKVLRQQPQTLERLNLEWACKKVADSPVERYHGRTDEYLENFVDNNQLP